MKRVLTSAILLLMVVFAFASNPTVTVTAFTDNANNPRANIYTISFATSAALATVDSAFILASTSTPFDIGGGQGAHYSDSLAVLEFTSNEPLADSVRFTVLWQVTSAASPEVDAGDLKTWSTAKSDAVSLTNIGAGGVAVFAIRRHAGQSRKLRLIILENGGTKGSPQTITARLLIPKR